MNKGSFYFMLSGLKKATITLMAGATLGAGALFASNTTASADEVQTDYTVKAGDTLSGISQMFGISDYRILAESNHLTNPNVLEIGQIIKITDTNIKGNSNTTTAPVQSAKVQTVASSTVAQKTTTYSAPVAKATPSVSNSGNISASGAAQAMAQRTGVSASTWQAIINRESGGNAQISNPSSGAFGLFQLLGHGEHPGMSVSEQVDMAANLYHQAGGMSPWAL